MKRRLTAANQSNQLAAMLEYEGFGIVVFWERRGHFVAVRDAREA